MNSNQNSFSNDFNFDQMYKDCKQGLNSIVNRMPFFIKIVVFSTLIFYLINLFTSYISFYLVNIPYFTIWNFQIWRLVTTPFITTSIINIILSLLFWYRDAVKQEEEKGTIKYMLNFFIMSFFIQSLYCLLMLLITLIVQNTVILRLKLNTGTLENSGLWPILMCELTLLCLSNPDQEMRFFCFPCIIRAKYYPLVLFCFFTIISGFNVDFEIICAIGFGFLFQYHLYNKLEISDSFALKVENSFLCQWMTSKKGFVSINNIGSTNIPQTFENATDSQPKSSSFTAFQGKGVTVGSADGSVSRENVDYAHLSSKNNEENITDEETLKVNNTDNPV